MYKLIVYISDMMALLGISETTARRIAARIREAENKGPGDDITAFEFCRHQNMRVIDYILWIHMCHMVRLNKITK